MRRSVCAVAIAWAARAGAQTPPPDAALTRCIGQRVTKISIEPIGPQFGGASASSTLVTGLVRKFHIDSRARVIRRVRAAEGRGDLH